MGETVRIGPFDVPVAVPILLGVGGLVYVMVRTFTTEDPEIRRAVRKIERKRGQLEAQKRNARTRTQVKVIEKKEERLDSLAARIESGQYRPSEIRELMASGTLSLR